jgi:hypothetical protein
MRLNLVVLQLHPSGRRDQTSLARRPDNILELNDAALIVKSFVIRENYRTKQEHIVPFFVPSQHALVRVLCAPCVDGNRLNIKQRKGFAEI